MNPVVVRCPNCGSTQATLGECETCHEATAGYYCPNHAPGRWLDGPQCDACGASVGMEPRRPRPSDVTPRPPSRAVEWGPPPSTTPEVADETRAEFSELVEAMRHAARAAERGAEPEVEERYVTVDPGAAARVVARGAFGCIAKAILFLVVLAVLAMLALGGFIGGYDDPSSSPATLTSTMWTNAEALTTRAA